MAEKVLDVHRAGTAAATANARGLAPIVGARGRRVETLAQALLAKFVVKLTLFRIGQGLIGAVDVLEAGFDLLVARVLVGVKLASQLAVSLLDLVVAGAARNSELFVEIDGLGSKVK